MAKLMEIEVCPVCNGLTTAHHGEDCWHCRGTGTLLQHAGETITYEEASAYMRWYEESRKEI